MKKAFIVTGIIIVTGAAALGYHLYKQQAYTKESVPAGVSIAEIVKEQEQLQHQKNADGTTQDSSLSNEGNQQNSGKNPSYLLPELNIAMTFYPQAPFGDWDYPWQETCEEASMLLVANTYFNHQWSRDDFRDELLKLVDWENKKFGDYKHTDVQQNVEILKDYLGLESKVVEDPGFVDVQKALNKGHLIVMTFAGKKLGNPFYKNGGPIYHAMVVKGYKEGYKIITNDVGTKHGEDYVYNWATIQNALHDYAEPIENGARKMIEVLPPRSL